MTADQHAVVSGRQMHISSHQFTSVHISSHPVNIRRQAEDVRSTSEDRQKTLKNGQKPHLNTDFADFADSFENPKH
jgi:hypothetical protein